MDEQRHTIEELKQWQALPLHVKVGMSMTRIRQWVHEYFEDGVYVSFSGGKDSTVLSHLVDRAIPGNNIPRVFVNTGLEYPEVVQFVRKEPRAVIVRPKMNFKKVIEQYGYPFFSKETSEVIYNAKKYLTKLANAETIDDRQTDSCSCRINTVTTDYSDKASMLNPSRGGQTQSTENSVDLVSLAKQKDKWTMPWRVACCLGTFEPHWQEKKMGVIPKDGSKSRYSQERFQFMLNAPFDVSHMCCNKMKKEPLHRYQVETHRNSITGEMAQESFLRTTKWLKNGCNGFNLKFPKSTPMAFWTENDVLQYIRENNLEIASVYGDIVADTRKDNVVEGQMRIEDFLGGECKLRTTGCQRTGCMFCGFGCHLEKQGEGRFSRLKSTHPKIYEWIMKPWDQGGLGYKEVIDWINEHGGFHIEY